MGALEVQQVGGRAYAREAPRRGMGLSEVQLTGIGSICYISLIGT